jgi:hypothetical protein
VEERLATVAPDSFLWRAPVGTGITIPEGIGEVRNYFLLRNNIFVSLGQYITDVRGKVADIVGLDHFKLLLDVWVEEPIEIEPVRALLPTSEVGNLVAMYNIALGAQLGNLADLRINCCKEQP